MKRQPHFRYYWDSVNDEPGIHNLRTNQIFRMNRNNKSPHLSRNPSEIWIATGFRITRHQYRLYRRTGKCPTCSLSLF